MSHQRNFDFPIALLVGQANRLLAALRDPVVGPSVLKRLKAGFDAVLDAQIKLVQKGGTDKSTAEGGIHLLTQAQANAYNEMERLMSDARHSASLVFSKGEALLKLEKHGGVADDGGGDNGGGNDTAAI